MARKMPNSTTMETRKIANLPEGTRQEVHDILGIEARGNSKSRLFGAILRWSYRWARLYGFLRETHTYLCRMGVVLRSNVYRNGVNAGPAFQETEERGWTACKRTLVRTQDMRQILYSEDMPWDPTPLDFCLFLRGWDAGEKWGYRVYSNNTGSRSPD
jgi:hypothetical protein